MKFSIKDFFSKSDHIRRKTYAVWKLLCSVKVMLAHDFLFPIKILMHFFANMNVELYKVFEWIKSNKLSLNVGKTKWASFHPFSKREFLC